MDYQSPHHYMGAGEFGDLYQIHLRRLEKISQSPQPPTGAFSDADFFIQLWSASQERIWAKQTEAAKDLVGFLAELGLSGANLAATLTRSVTGYTSGAPSEDVVRTLSDLCRRVGDCIGRIRCAALDSLLGTCDQSETASK